MTPETKISLLEAEGMVEDAWRHLQQIDRSDLAVAEQAALDSVIEDLDLLHFDIMGIYAEAPEPEAEG